MQKKGIINIKDLKANNTQEIKKTDLDKLKIIEDAGEKEIKQFENLIRNFIQDLEKLAICKNLIDTILGEQIWYFLNTEVLEALIKPVFRGEELPFLDINSYQEMREEMYNSLIEKYIK